MLGPSFYPVILLFFSKVKLTCPLLAVGKRDIESSKLAFVSSATALEKWISLTGLVGQLKGL